MTLTPKRADRLTVADFVEHPAWEFLQKGGRVSSRVRPVEHLPIDSGDQRLIGTRVTFADGRERWAVLQHLNPKDPEATEHLLHVSLDIDGEWFHLARYHDAVQRDDPKALAKRLRCRLDDIFPMRYDVGHLMVGEADAIRGEIRSQPRVRLTKDQIFGMILDGR